MLKKTLILSSAALILIAAWYFLWYKPDKDAAAALMDGAPCKTGGFSGTIQNGACVENKPKAETLPCGGKLNPC